MSFFCILLIQLCGCLSCAGALPHDILRNRENRRTPRFTIIIAAPWPAVCFLQKLRRYCQIHQFRHVAGFAGVNASALKIFRTKVPVKQSISLWI
jgi:hypothetical protein